MDRSPSVKKPRSLAGYLEALSRPVFQAGMRRPFRFIGDSGACYFLYVAGELSPWPV